MRERYPLPPDVSAALDRARLQVEALAQTADELQVVLPDAVGSALRDGLREEAAPSGSRPTCWPSGTRAWTTSPCSST